MVKGLESPISVIVNIGDSLRFEDQLSVEVASLTEGAHAQWTLWVKSPIFSIANIGDSDATTILAIRGRLALSKATRSPNGQRPKSPIFEIRNIGDLRVGGDHGYKETYLCDRVRDLLQSRRQQMEDAARKDRVPSTVGVSLVLDAEVERDLRGDLAP